MRDSGQDAPSFSGQLRPRYQRCLDLSHDHVTRRLREALAARTAPCEGSVVSEIISLSIRRSERHMWSPKLEIRIGTDQGQTLLTGRYGPMPAIWTFIVFCYAVAVSAGIISAVYAYAMSFTGGETLAGWGVLVAALVIGAIYGASYIGQKLGHQQMDTIHHFVDEALREPASPPEAGESA